jgi:outer membrane protein
MQSKVKKLIGLSLIALLTFVLAGCSSPQAKIGIMDMEKVLEKSERASVLRKKLTEIGNNLENNYQNKEEKLSSDKQKQEQERIYQEFLNNKKELEGQLNNEIDKVLKQITRENNIEIVLYKNGVHYGGLNITEEVIKLLDSQNNGNGGQNDAGE